ALVLALLLSAASASATVTFIGEGDIHSRVRAPAVLTVPAGPPRSRSGRSALSAVALRAAPGRGGARTPALEARRCGPGLRAPDERVAHVVVSFQRCRAADGGGTTGPTSPSGAASRSTMTGA